jgi:large subunit ribosomal protein L41
MNASRFVSSIFKRASCFVVATPFVQQQQRFMSKYLSKSATKRLPLTTKRAGKGYYKGKGGTKEGKITSKGKFRVDKSKRLQLIVPELEGFMVR